jgi:excisionase family DNA binding protein
MESIAKKALSVNEFRQLYGLGRTTVYKEIALGNIKIIKCGRRTLIPVDESDEFLRRLEAASK